ncbi:TlpA disulfide reductase family protein [Maribacter sp. SA7]|uniref:TlpA family protein disulfide reductase n=1 Tax=Maribacter zhoushanensis TaxID=3030012 RepID=UPI0023EB00CE|nr:TlpA disulfide reductase family protein [Maribacter zhoushanensis]MDF4201769.1 TlpA disulfide reductase family protein [Maribacter zhoushanensis]
MKVFISICLLLFSLSIQAQGSIAGNFSPPKDFKWIIAYELTPNGERYSVDGAVRDGSFELEMPLTAQAGMYRLVYAVPQDEFYIDIIYDKKEDVKINFNLQDGLTITNSEENKWYREYFSKITSAQDKLIEFYETNSEPNKEYNSILKELNTIQTTFEEKHAATIAHKFIKANRSYIPAEFENLETFLKNKKQHHFDHLAINDPVLQGSNFLIDKFASYVFSALPTNITTKEQLAIEVNKNIETTVAQIKPTPIGFQERAMYQLWQIAEANGMPTVQDYIFNNHLKKLAVTNNNQKLVDEIEMASRLRIGTVSPDITWQVDGKTHSLLTMEAAENYLLVFWSSTCSHCLKELPQLHKEVEDYENLKIIAVGLEDDDVNWKEVSATLPGFNHAIALGRWESEYAKTFGIQSTPTYFILDSEKRFSAKPESDKEVVEFLEN